MGPVCFLVVCLFRGHCCQAHGEWSCGMMWTSRQTERIEIANEYACYLWEELQQHEKAVAVWAEHVLPFATAEYWNEFTRRLDKVGVVCGGGLAG